MHAYDRPGHRNCMRMDPTYRRLYCLRKSRIDDTYTGIDGYKGRVGLTGSSLGVSVRKL